MSYIRNAFEYLEASALRVPDKTAFADASRSFSFAEILEAALSVGSGLTGFFRGRAVVLCGRNVMSLIGMFGAMSAGLTYVPVDAKMPEDRLQRILETVSPCCILYCAEDTKTAAKYSEYASIIEIDSAVGGSYSSDALKAVREKVLDIDPAYMIFTSGSTGNPKGIAVSHRSLIDFTEWMAEECGLDENDVLGNQAPFFFDLSVKDIYQTLKLGCTTHILEKKLFMFPTLLIDCLCEKGVTGLVWATSAFRMTADSGILDKKVPQYVKKIILGGEALQAKHLNIWKKALPDLNVINLYGPTEVTVDCTYYKIERDFSDGEPIPIGQACRNMEVMLLDDDLQSVPDGEPGEICVRGIGLALGYFGEHDKTCEAFVQNPANPYYPDLIYRTGDIGKIGADGMIYYLCRRDGQIKHSGYRIELGEIETALSAADGIREAVCFFDAAADAIVCSAVIDTELNLVTAELKKRLPAYMLPNRWRVYDRLPGTANGKIDRVKLKELYENKEN